MTLDPNDVLKFDKAVVRYNGKEYPFDKSINVAIEFLRMSNEIKPSFFRKLEVDVCYSMYTAAKRITLKGKKDVVVRDLEKIRDQWVDMGIDIGPSALGPVEPRGNAQSRRRRQPPEGKKGNP